MSSLLKAAVTTVTPIPIPDQVAASNQDAITVGGGFYGVAIAFYLAKQRGLKPAILANATSLQSIKRKEC